MTFSLGWFARHQRALLVLLNLPIVGQVLRRAMWIPELWLPITSILPDAVHAWVGPGKRRATIYSNPQYAEGLHRSFGWLWAAVHWWDMEIANRWLPALNMGLDTYTSQPDSASSRDNYIYTSSPNVNPSDGAIYVGERDGGTELQRGLIAFDFSSIPIGSGADSAVLSLWQFNETAANTRVFRLYRLKRAWVSSQVTYNIYATGNSWQTAGGFGVNDCEQTGIASLSLTGTEANGEKQWTNWDLDLLGEMFGTVPSWSNNGWLLKADTESNDEHAFRSSRYATTPSQRPKMVIDYTFLNLRAALRLVGSMIANARFLNYRIFSSSVPRRTYTSNGDD